MTKRVRRAFLFLVVVVVRYETFVTKVIVDKNIGTASSSQFKERKNTTSPQQKTTTM